MTASNIFAAIAPNKPAIVLDVTVITYAELDKRTGEVARLFRASRTRADGSGGGLDVSGVVAMLAENRADAFVVAWATQRGGLYLVPIGTKLTPSEIAYILEDSQAGILVCSPALASLAMQAVALLGQDVPVPTLYELGEGGGQLQGLNGAAKVFAEDDLIELEGSDMLYTSGTTGRPKGVKRPLSGKAFGADTSRADRSRDLFKMNADTVFLSPAPLYHAAPLRFAMSVHRLGGTVVVMKKFDAHQAWHLLHQHQVTHSQWAPTMFNRLLGARDALAPIALPNSHRVAIHAGAPCPVPVKHQMIKWWGPILHEYYSGTESIGFTHIDSREWLVKTGSVGRAIGCNIHIVDAKTGDVVPVGQTGMVYFEGKAPLVYHNSEDKTAASTHPKGWATMGDIGHVDADNYLFLTDRAAFTIISGGVNIYPKEIEDALLEQSIVTDAAVFGVPDPDLGEKVIAAVTLEPGTPKNAKTAAQIGLALRSNLSSIKVPKRIIFYDELPRSDAGKLLKRELQNQFATSAAATGFPTREALAA
jgi:long-chain acyl-CoA synthetase